MIVLEQVVAFFDEFTTAEYEAEIAARSNPDEAFATSAEDIVRRFFITGHPMATGVFHRSPGSPPVASEADVRKLFQRRIVVRATEFETVAVPLYAVSVTSKWAGDRTVSSVYYMQEVADLGLRIVAQYNGCNDCHQTGKVKRRVCDECHGRGWCWRGGLKLPEDGKQLRVLEVSGS